MVILRRCNPIIAKVNQEWVLTDDALAKQSRARYGFKILGAGATSAVPELGRMLISSNDLASFHSAMSLGYVGEAGWPTLFAALTNQDEKIWFNVCRVLEDLGTNSAPVIPLLVHNLREADPAVRLRAASALAKLPIEPGIVVPALIMSLQDPDSSVREEAVRALAEHESQAILAVPDLLQLRNDPVPFIRDLTDHALIRIDREALAKANSQ